MKLSSFFFSKESLAKKIERRNAKRIKEYTRISTAFHPEESQALRENLDSIARFAERKNINLEFVPNIKSDNNKMKVYKRGYTFVDYPGEIGRKLPVPSSEFQGDALIPKSLTTKEEIMNAIKTEASKIIYNKK